MSPFHLLRKKLLASPELVQFLIAADCLHEMGLPDQAAMLRLQYDPDICTVWLGNVFHAGTGAYGRFGSGSGGGAGNGSGSGGSHPNFGHGGRFSEPSPDPFSSFGESLQISTELP